MSEAKHEVWSLTLETTEVAAHEAADALGFLDESMEEALAISIDYSGGKHVVQALYPTREAAERGQEQIGGTVAQLEDRDWVSETQAGLPPVPAGRFLLYGSHEDPGVADDAPVPILVDAGMAFGSGHHGTTAGCLGLFDQRLREIEVGESDGYARVLDLGTGSGVLAIAAAKALGVTVEASDIDADAVEVTKANAEANGVGGRVSVWQADGLHDDRFETYDLVFANILAGPLMALAPDIARVSEGDVILSGILVEQADDVSKVFAMEGFTETARRTLGEWVSILMQKGPTSLPGLSSGL